jgi:uncharacterized protein (TIGR03382 family)
MDSKFPRGGRATLLAGILALGACPALAGASSMEPERAPMMVPAPSLEVVIQWNESEDSSDVASERFEAGDARQFPFVMLYRITGEVACGPDAAYEGDFELSGPDLHTAEGIGVSGPHSTGAVVEIPAGLHPNGYPDGGGSAVGRGYSLGVAWGVDVPQDWTNTYRISVDGFRKRGMASCLPEPTMPGQSSIQLSLQADSTGRSTGGDPSTPMPGPSACLAVLLAAAIARRRRFL